MNQKHSGAVLSNKTFYTSMIIGLHYTNIFYIHH